MMHLSHHSSNQLSLIRDGHLKVASLPEHPGMQHTGFAAEVAGCGFITKVSGISVYKRRIYCFPCKVINYCALWEIQVCADSLYPSIIDQNIGFFKCSLIINYNTGIFKAVDLIPFIAHSFNTCIVLSSNQVQRKNEEKQIN